MRVRIYEWIPCSWILGTLTIMSYHINKKFQPFSPTRVLFKKNHRLRWKASFWNSLWNTFFFEKVPWDGRNFQNNFSQFLNLLFLNILKVYKQYAPNYASVKWLKLFARFKVWIDRQKPRASDFQSQGRKIKITYTWCVPGCEFDFRNYQTKLNWNLYTHLQRIKDWKYVLKNDGVFTDRQETK